MPPVLEQKQKQQQQQKKALRKKKKHFFKIEAIYIYPIKSCAPMRVDHWWPLKRQGGGFEYDRAWVIVDQNQVALSQKRHAISLTNLRAQVDLGLGRLKLEYRNEEAFEMSVNAAAAAEHDGEGSSSVYHMGMRCVDEGDRVAEWLTRVLGLASQCRLLRLMAPADRRDTFNRDHNASSTSTLASFNKKADFLLVNETSVKKLRKFLDRRLGYFLLFFQTFQSECLSRKEDAVSIHILCTGKLTTLSSNMETVFNLGSPFVSYRQLRQNTTDTTPLTSTDYEFGFTF